MNLNVLTLIFAACLSKPFESLYFPFHPMSYSHQHPADEVRKLDDGIWAIITNFSNGQSPFPFSSSSQTSHSSFEAQSSRSSVRAPSFHSGLTSSLRASESLSNDPSHSSHPDPTQVLCALTGGSHAGSCQVTPGLTINQQSFTLKIQIVIIYSSSWH